MSETETRWLDDDDGTLDARTVRQLRADKARYKDDRDEAWAKCANEECECVASVQAELARLRAVVEAVQALADQALADSTDASDDDLCQWRDEHDCHATARYFLAERINAALNPPVSSSGEGSGCETCGGSGFIAEADDPDYPEAGAHQIHCPDCPALSSGGAESGEGAHPEDFCQRCGGRNVKPWFAPSDVWNAVVGDEWSIICPQCFVELAERSERFADEAWELRPTIRYPAPVLSGGRDLLAALGSAVEAARQDRRATAVLSGGQADGEGRTRVVDEAGLLALPIRSVIAGPAWNSEVYLKAGPDEWFAPAQPDEWTSRTLSHRGPFVVLRLGDEPLATRPVLSREALRERLAATLRQNGHVEWTDLDVRNMTEHVLDVLAGGEQRG